MNNPSLLHQPVGAIAAMDFRTAPLLSRAGIDFCCGGKMTLSEACLQNGINPSELQQSLFEALESPLNKSAVYNEWPIGFLCDYITHVHHTYVRSVLPDLLTFTQKIASVHGEHHPELIGIAGCMENINDEMVQHMKMEEEVLFPAIKSLAVKKEPTLKETIQSEIRRMLTEHDYVGNASDDIMKVTHNYFEPEDACSTYRTALKLLKEFGEDLHIHVHLENNILFPRALALES